MDYAIRPFSAEDLEQTDEQLGWQLVATWVGHHAIKAGFNPHEIPPQWAEKLIAETAKMDSDSVSNAALESMFRKACAGDMTTAGKMLRDYLQRGAQEMVNQKYANIGISKAMGNKRGGKHTAKAKQEKAATWHTKVERKARELLAQSIPARDLAGKLSQTCDVSADRIRRHLKKVGVK